jgi:hypothetical protein
MTKPTNIATRIIAIEFAHDPNDNSHIEPLRPFRAIIPARRVSRMHRNNHGITVQGAVGYGGNRVGKGVALGTISVAVGVLCFGCLSCLASALSASNVKSASIMQKHSVNNSSLIF